MMLPWKEVLVAAAKPLIGFAVLAAVVLGGAWFLGGSCDDGGSEAKDQILDDEAERRAERGERLESIETTLNELRQAIEKLDAEIAKAVQEREEAHDEIDLARSISDIDRLVYGYSEE